ncbi:MAG: T9SS type A sorting domain-containing protein, partial [Candidatus Kapaibacterium sp.]
SVTIPQQSVCRGDSLSMRPVIFGGVRPFTYFWSAVDFPFVSTDSVPKFGPDTTRLWSLTLTDSVGCTTEVPFTILVKPGPDKPVIERTGSTLVSSTLAARYQWYLNGKAITGAVARSYALDTTKIKSGWILVEVRDVNGCASRSDSLQVSTVTSVDPFDVVEWHAFPNPVADRLSVSGMFGDAPTEVDVVSVLGERVRTMTTPVSASACVVPMADLPSGTYLVSVRNGQQRRVFRIVKE